MTITEQHHEVGEVDIVGDVHGCYDELIQLCEKLGYVKKNGLYEHPEGRKLVFVGDLVDRGPKNRKSIDFALDHIEAGLAFAVQGNHDNKFHRWAKSNPVKISSGLQKTVDEIEENYSEDEIKKRFHKRIKDWPVSLEFDGGDLIVCHAAPPPDNCSKGKKESVCLYGHTTGQTTEHGFPERGTWDESWNRSNHDSFVVYGHVTHKEVKLTSQTACVDTSCYAGNKLSALRWPQKEVVSVESHQEEREISYADNWERPQLDPYGDVPESEEISIVHIRELLDDLEEREEEILYLINHDDDLKKRQHENGLVIANASKSLYFPEKHHQLYSKGIVYKRDPYRLVSLPLVKMYNHGRNEISDGVTSELEDQSEIEFEWAEKVDGAMIQLFAHKGETYFTTRSVLEGTHEDIKEQGDSDFTYVEEAREIAEEINPRLCDPPFVDGKTMIFELLHPEGGEGVTDYGEKKDLVLLSVWDRYDNRYWKTEEVVRFGNRHDISTSDILLDESDLERGVDKLLDELEDDPAVPEGAVLCFENDEEVLHRVKIKTQAWLRRFKLKFECSYRNTANMLWDKPHLHDWDSFLKFLREEGLTEEEVEEFYREHFERFMDYMEDVREKKRKVDSIVEDYYDRNGTMEESDLDESEFNKKLALHFKEEEPDLFHMIMSKHRDELTLKDVMKYNPAHKKFKGVIVEAEKGSITL